MVSTFVWKIHVLNQTKHLCSPRAVPRVTYNSWNQTLRRSYYKCGGIYLDFFQIIWFTLSTFAFLVCKLTSASLGEDRPASKYHSYGPTYIDTEIPLILTVRLLQEYYLLFPRLSFNPIIISSQMARSSVDLRTWSLRVCSESFALMYLISSFYVSALQLSILADICTRPHSLLDARTCISTDYLGSFSSLVNKLVPSGSTPQTSAYGRFTVDLSVHCVWNISKKWPIRNEGKDRMSTRHFDASRFETTSLNFTITLPPYPSLPCSVNCFFSTVKVKLLEPAAWKSSKIRSSSQAVDLTAGGAFGVWETGQEDEPAPALRELWHHLALTLPRNACCSLRNLGSVLWYMRFDDLWSCQCQLWQPWL